MKVICEHDRPLDSQAFESLRSDRGDCSVRDEKENVSIGVTQRVRNVQTIDRVREREWE